MKKVFIAGHKGMVGSAISRQIVGDPTTQVITIDRSHLDLLNQSAVFDFFEKHCFDHVYMAAAKVGGIYANSTFPGDFVYQNLVLQSNIIEAARRSHVSRLLFLGSSCIYPKAAGQPICEEELLTGSLEPTNEPYAVAKIAGITLCDAYNRQYGTDFRCVMPTNLYGIGDNYHPMNSHVVPALIRRFHESKITDEPEVEIWGTGAPRREFLFSEDLASACVRVMQLDTKKYMEILGDGVTHLNIGTGIDLEIKELAALIKKIVGYSGEIRFDDAKPDGTPRKLLDISRLKKMDWAPSVSLQKGLQLAYDDFLNSEYENVS